MGPAGGHIFFYEEVEGITRHLPQRERINVQACAILEQCTGYNTVEDIGLLVEKEFEKTPPDLLSQVCAFLNEAVAKGYVTYCDHPAQKEGVIQGSIHYYTPSTVLLETTLTCNLKCGHCLVSAGEPLPDELTASQLICVLERLYTMGVREVRLSGGEVLIKKGWDRVTEFCVNRFDTRVLTNGMFLTEDIAGMLVGCQEVHVSLYGSTAEPHERISQVTGSFDTAVSGIRLLTDKGISTGISFIATPFNNHHVEDVVHLAGLLGCTIVKVGIVSPVGRARKRKWELTECEKKELDETVVHLKEKYADIDIRWEEEKVEKHQHTCGAGYTSWTVTANGDVYPCSIFRILLGNVWKEDPVDILTSPAVQFLQGVTAPHEAMCGDCTYLYVCEECHGQALAHWDRVNHCRWVEQFSDAPEPFKSVVKGTYC
jgi:radical SAM protein with 4Fe4S-binding SPASM domain